MERNGGGQRYAVDTRGAMAIAAIPCGTDLTPLRLLLLRRHL